MSDRITAGNAKAALERWVGLVGGRVATAAGGSKPTYSIEQLYGGAIALRRHAERGGSVEAIAYFANKREWWNAVNFAEATAREMDRNAS